MITTGHLRRVTPAIANKISVFFWWPKKNRRKNSCIMESDEDMDELATLIEQTGLAHAANVRQPPVLDSFDLQGIVDYIDANDVKNIIVMAGAGISVSAGIPDFRSPGTGLYHNLQKYDLPNPQSIFSIDFFRENPEPFYMLAKELYPGLFKPTPTHYFIRLLAEKGKLLRVFTQNIDSLERIAGIDTDLIVPAHGNFDSAHCIETGEEVDVDEVKDAILRGKEGWTALTEKYGGLVKPDIVFFGESLPPLFEQRVGEDFPKCDLLIVMGTSLVVQPFASLIDMVPDTVPRLLVNREEAGNDYVLIYEAPWQSSCWVGDCSCGVFHEIKRSPSAVRERHE
eukprot:m.38253 g.38253  ORF g.38253 m.38253 type:complete len:340 (+) comp14620_c0_seq3:163-1182(+)